MEQREILNDSFIGEKDIDEGPTLEELMSTFGGYFSKLPQILQGADNHQLYILRKKYRYYLTKLTKFQSTLTHLKTQYNKLDQTVLNSQVVKEAMEGIGFVQMVSSETISKLAISGLIVEQGKSNHRSYKQRIIELKREVNEQKNIFFKLKKEQSRIRAEIQTQKSKRYRQYYEAIFKLARDSHKKRQQKTMKSSKMQSSLYSISKLQINSRFFSDENNQSKLQRVEQIQNMKKEFMVLLKKICGKIPFNSMKNIHRYGSTSFYKCESKEIRLKLYQSKLKSLTKKQKNTHKYHSPSTLPLETMTNNQFDNQNLLTTADTFEAFANLENERIRFREVELEELLKIICQRGKISEVLNLIQKQKKNILK